MNRTRQRALRKNFEAEHGHPPADTTPVRRLGVIVGWAISEWRRLKKAHFAGRRNGETEPGTITQRAFAADRHRANGRRRRQKERDVGRAASRFRVGQPDIARLMANPEVRQDFLERGPAALGLGLLLALLPCLAQAQHYRGEVASYVPAPEIDPLSVRQWDGVGPAVWSSIPGGVSMLAEAKHVRLSEATIVQEARVERDLEAARDEKEPAKEPPACSDGLDNDLDGEKDFPEEGCDSPEDTTETQFGMRLAVLTGGSVSLSSDADPVGAPLVRLQIDWDLAKGDRTPDMFLVADFTATPGETVRLDKPETFRALEFTLGLRERPIRGLAAWGWVGFGFVTRLPNDPEPLDRTARWIGGGLEFRSKRGDFLRIGLEATQLFDGFYRAATVIEGMVMLAEESVGNLKGAVYLLGRALLGLDYASARGAPARHDVVTVSVAVGGGGKKS